MDGEDENTPYLNILNDPTHGYLLSNGEVELTDSLAVEPIFTEIGTADWVSDGFPILLSGPLIAEGPENNEGTGTNAPLFSGDQLQLTYGCDQATNQNGVEDEQNLSVIRTNETPLEKSTENDLMLHKDIVLQINNAEVQTNSTSDESHLPPCVIMDGQIHVQPLGKDAFVTFTTVSQNQPNIQGTPDEKQHNNLKQNDGTSLNEVAASSEKANVSPVAHLNEYFESVAAYKCKICSFLCITASDMEKHLSETHQEQIKKPNLEVNYQSSNKQNQSILIGSNMKSILNTHDQNKQKVLMFLCSKCDIGYSNKDELKQHMIMVHHLTSEKTSQSENGNVNGVNEKKHSPRGFSAILIKKQQKALKRIKCSIEGCSLKFARDELKEQHVECHVGEQRNQFMCFVCQEKFSIWRICSNHLWKCHKIDLGLITCPMCNTFKSNSADRVRKHMATHNDERPFLCSECGRGFKQLTQLKNHEVVHKAPEDMPNWSCMKKCDICERYFANSKSWKKHVQVVHDKFKPFICNICGHKTARKAMLELHLRQHTGLKPHQCSYCDYKTGDHNSLRRHIMRHIGIMKYSCPYCDYQSIQSAAFKKHMANRHPGKTGTYSCRLCSYTYINPASYLSHVKCHEVGDIADQELEEASTTNDIIITTPGGQIERHQTFQLEMEDEETQNGFLSTDTTDEMIDTGGITIPAGSEMQL